MDKLSVKKILMFVIVICVFSNIGLIYSDSLVLAFIMRSLMGGTSAFALMPCLKLARVWLPKEQIGTAIGMCITIGMCGGLIVQAPAEMLLNSFGGRCVLVANFIFGLIVLVLTYLFVKDRPKNFSRAKLDDTVHLPFIKRLGNVVMNRQNWFSGIYIGLMNLPIMLLGALWGIGYLVRVHHQTASSAASITSMIFLGAVFGMIFFGWFSDIIRNRRLPMIYGAVSAMIIVIGIIILPVGYSPILYLLFFLLGFNTSSQVIGYPVITESNSFELLGTATAMCNLLVFTCASISQPLFGWILELYSSNTEIVGYYSADSYQYAMLSLPISFFVALALAIILRETACRKRK